MPGRSSQSEVEQAVRQLVAAHSGKNDDFQYLCLLQDHVQVSRHRNSCIATSGATVPDCLAAMHRHNLHNVIAAQPSSLRYRE